MVASQPARITAQASDQPNQSTHASPRAVVAVVLRRAPNESRDHHASSRGMDGLQFMYAQAAGVAGASPR